MEPGSDAEAVAQDVVFESEVDFASKSASQDAAGSTIALGPDSRLEELSVEESSAWRRGGRPVALLIPALIRHE